MTRPNLTDRSKPGTRHHISISAEHPLAGLPGYRRLRTRDERRDDIHLAFLLLGCALLCSTFLP